MTQPTDGLLRVTGILRLAGLTDVEWVKQEYLDRGTAVHVACQLIDENDLDFKTVHESIQGRLRQYQKFKEQVRPEIEGIEQEVVNNALQYRGRCDRIVKLNGSHGVLDIKGSMEAPWQAIQLALYAMCFSQGMRRWTLHLSDDRYKLIEHKDPTDYAVAKAAITVAGWRRRHERTRDDHTAEADAAAAGG